MTTEPPAGRFVAALWCTDVLARLPDFVDGTLSEAEHEQVQAHLEGCDWCERFGGAYAGVVTALRRKAAAEAVGGPAPDVTDRVLERLRSA